MFSIVFVREMGDGRNGLIWGKSNLKLDFIMTFILHHNDK